MGCRTMTGYDSEIEHLYGGRTRTVICQNGKPVEGAGLEARSALEGCADERRRQSGAVRVFLVVGVLTVAAGAFELRKARAG